MAPRPTPELRALASAARQALAANVDPELALSFVLWPTPDVLDAVRGRRARALPR